MTGSRERIVVIACAVAVSVSGCSMRSVSSTPRTAIEQLLLSAAVDNALSKMEVQELSGSKVYLDFSHLEGYDVEYIKLAFYARMAELGVTVVETAEQADYSILVSSGAFGNEYKETMVGIPAFGVPGSVISLPELALWKTVAQNGIIKLLIVDYYGKAERDETFLLWMRSQKKDDIRKGWEEADRRLQAGEGGL
ncbi:MAG: DUF6655 family protein [Planctomycetota bacterium]